MHIPPARRRRILKVHHLRQQGKSLRKIAEQVKISHATVHADLKLVETHWAEIALPAADDLLLNQVHIIQRRLARVLQQDLSAAFNQRPEQEVDLPGLTNANHSDQPISQPAQEIVDPGPSEKNVANHSDHPLPDNILEEAQTFLKQRRKQEFHPTHAFADAAGG